MMQFEVRVVEPNVFKAYLQYRVDHPNGTNADALGAVGLPELAVTTHPFESRRGEQAPMASK